MSGSTRVVRWHIYFTTGTFDDCKLLKQRSFFCCQYICFWMKYLVIPHCTPDKFGGELSRILFVNWESPSPTIDLNLSSDALDLLWTPKAKILSTPAHRGLLGNWRWRGLVYVNKFYAKNNFQREWGWRVNPINSAWGKMEFFWSWSKARYVLPYSYILNTITSLQWNPVNKVING